MVKALGKNKVAGFSGVFWPGIICSTMDDCARQLNGKPPAKQLTVPRIDMKASSQLTNHYVAVFDGFINVPTTGKYDFKTISNDGSQALCLLIHDRP